MTSSILQIIGVIVGIIGASIISRIINKYWQAYQDYRNAGQLDDEKKSIQDDLKRRNDEHKKLKDIEDNFNGK